ncbi:MAG: serine hydrolase domain-containing protein [Thermomonas sp.]
MAVRIAASEAGDLAGLVPSGRQTARAGRCLAVCLVGLLAAPALGQEAKPAPPAQLADVGISAERLQRLDRFMRDATDADGYLGGVVLIARNGHVVDWQAYGHRDIGRHDPMRRDSIFRIYSMTKTVASVALMMLVEEGKLSLDDPVERFLPAFAHMQVLVGGTAYAPELQPAKTPITLHELLTHTAGLPAGLPGDDVAVALQERAEPHGAADLREFVSRLSGAPLAADPGTRFGYDGAALETIARVIEVVSGQPFAEFLQQRIFAPLRMRDTGFRMPVAQRGRVVDITRTGDDGKLRLDDGPSARQPGEPLNAYDSGAGGLYSTAGDYARFAQMLLDGGTFEGHSMLGRKTVELMLANHLTMLDPPVTQFSDAEGFGIGGYVVLDPARRGQPGSVGQYGWAGAASTTFMIDPREKLVAILLLQHLPRGDGKPDLPRLSRPFYTLVYQALL